MASDELKINPKWRLFHQDDHFWIARDQLDADGRWTGRCESLQLDGTWREQRQGDMCDIIPCVNMARRVEPYIGDPGDETD